jgi:hypothetical protein
MTSRLGLETPWLLRLAAVAVVAHGLLVLNDGHYWDGWLYYSYVRDGRWDLLREITAEAGGFPVNAYLRWWLGNLPGGIGGVHAIVFLALATSAWMVYLIGTTGRFLEREEAFWIAALALVYPAYQVTVEFTTARYVIGYALFLAATAAALRFERETGVRRHIARLLSLTLFVASFRMESLLVLYAAALSLVVIDRMRSGMAVREVVTRYLPRRLDFLALPFVYWTLSLALFPRGSYADSYRIEFDAAAMWEGVLAFIGRAIFGQWRAAFEYAATAAWPLAGGLGVAAIVGFRSRRAGSTGARRGWPLIVFAMVVLVCAILPYVAVRRVPSLTGWDTRHALLIGLPVAMITVALASASAGAVRNGRAASRAILACATVLLAAATIRQYLEWQARWVRDRSVMVHLADLPHPAASVIWIDDSYRFGGEPYYRFYEWSSMFKSVWGSERIIGLDTRFPPYRENFLLNGRPSFNKLMLLSEFNPDGCQATLVIRPSRRPLSAAALTGAYFRVRFLQPERLDAFLRDVTDVEITPVRTEAPQCDAAS